MKNFVLIIALVSLELMHSGLPLQNRLPRGYRVIEPSETAQPFAPQQESTVSTELHSLAGAKGGK